MKKPLKNKSMNAKEVKTDEILLTQKEVNLIYNLMTICIHNLHWNYEGKEFIIDRKIVMFKDNQEFNEAKILREKISNLILTDDDLPF